jgi:hypothetical protein
MKAEKRDDIVQIKNRNRGKALFLFLREISDD